ncbi:MAG: hypothetical protein LC740_16120 [Actinobacteria bacterium]|nr:hypothetical protein [Actinomycetota bacterium]
MEIGRIFGLPAHPLFVHAVVVLVPLCAIGVVLCALWPAARRRLSLTVLVLSVFTAAMVPIVQASGEWFEDQVGRSALLERHTQLGDDFLPYAIALVIGAGAVAALRFMEARSEGNQMHSHGILLHPEASLFGRSGAARPQRESQPQAEEMTTFARNVK